LFVFVKSKVGCSHPEYIRANLIWKKSGFNAAYDLITNKNQRLEVFLTCNRIGTSWYASGRLTYQTTLIREFPISNSEKGLKIKDLAGKFARKSRPRRQALLRSSKGLGKSMRHAYAANR
jgi:hypothetical protein